MPVFKEVIDIPCGGKSMKLLLFDYSENSDDSTPVKSTKQLISVEPCMTMGTKNFTALSDEQREKMLKEGLQYSGYYIRTINGPYDYGYKLWIDRRLPFAPSNAKEPKETEPQEAMVIDENKGFLGIACGPHLAYCTAAALNDSGYCLEKEKLPFAGLKVKLRRKKEGRPSEIPYASFEAIPVGVDEIVAEEVDVEEVNKISHTELIVNEEKA